MNSTCGLLDVMQMAESAETADKQCQVASSGLQVLLAGDGAKGKACQHRLELGGRTPPWVMARLLEVLKESHQSAFQVRKERDFLLSTFQV